MISFIELLKISLKEYKRRFYNIIFLAALPFISYVLIYFYVSGITFDEIQSIPKRIVAAIYLIFFITLVVIYPLIIYIISKDADVKILPLIVSIKKKLLKVFILFLFTMILILSIITMLFLFYNNIIVFNILAVAFFTLTIKMFIDYFFSIQYIILKDCTIIEGLKYSKSIAKIHWTKIILYYITVQLTGTFLLQIIAAVLAYIVPIIEVYYIIIAFMQALFQLFVYVFLTVFYSHLKSNAS